MGWRMQGTTIWACTTRTWEMKGLQGPDQRSAVVASSCQLGVAALQLREELLAPFLHNRMGLTCNSSLQGGW